MADYSAFYRLRAPSYDGASYVGSFTFHEPGTNYREASIPDPLGIFPVNALTRVTQSQAPPQPVAECGALIVARMAGASASAEIGVVAADNGSTPTQLQPLRREPWARLWTFPGDGIYVKDPLDRGTLQLFVRPLNVRELDVLLSLPSATSQADVSMVSVSLGQVLPYTPGVRRTVYRLSPPAALTAYGMPTVADVEPGHELVFIGMNNRPFVLETTEDINGTTTFGNYFVPSFGTVTMISYGTGFAAQGTAQDRYRNIGSGVPITEWRGVLKLSITVAAAEAFNLPNVHNLPSDAALFVNCTGTANVTLAGSLGQMINGFASLTLSPGDGVHLVPAGTGWLTVMQ